MLQIHPDGRVIVVSGDDRYHDTLNNFETDFALTVNLPEKVKSVLIDDKRASMVTDKGQTQATDALVSLSAAAASGLLAALTAKATRNEIEAAQAAAEDHPLFGVTDINEARSLAKQITAGDTEQALMALTGHYSSSEQATWERQLQEAKSVQLDPTVPAPFLEALVIDNETKETIAASVVSKGEQMLLGAAPILKRKREVFDWIDNASLEDLSGFNPANI